jgi:cytoplasmic iron level regulating protein YaaA (DUF328/UPF0246 family)
MKIILSPSKTQKFDKPSSNGLKIPNQDKTYRLFQILKSQDIEELSKLLKIKNDLLDQTYKMYQKFDGNQSQYQALDLYDGVVFQQLNRHDYQEQENNYIKKNLTILSAMYGPLKPNTLIWPYRLDMTIKMRDINLYQYWQEVIDDYFEDEDIIINLASKEFSKMIKNHKKKMLSIDFKEKRENGQLRSISYNAKKARGQMLNQMIKDQISQVNDIKKITVDGYKYSEAHSKEGLLVFIK